MKISVSNVTKTKSELDKFQKRVSSRLITISDITDIVSEVEDYLSTILYKRDWKGVIVNYRYGEKYAASYNGVPQSTSIELTRGSSNWFITELRRETCGSIPVLMFNNIHEKKEEVIKYVASKKSKIYLN